GEARSAAARSSWAIAHSRCRYAERPRSRRSSSTGRGLGSADGAPRPAAGQLVLRGVVDGAAVGPFHREVLDGPADLLHGPAHGDAEHALAAAQQVDDLLGRRALVDGGAVGEQGDAREVADAAAAQVLDGHADVLQRHPGVEQALDHLQDEDVLERVQPLRAGARGTADRGHDEPGARPVVQLPVGDPDDLARGRSAETDELVGQAVEPFTEQRIGEELALLGRAGRRLLHRTPSAGARFRPPGGRAGTDGLRDIRRYEPPRAWSTRRAAGWWRVTAGRRGSPRA